jgi:tetratricopeptide (TPR) repeat protein
VHSRADPLTTHRPDTDAFFRFRSLADYYLGDRATQRIFVPPKLELSVFVSSPGDVAEERALAGRAFRRLANEFADVVVLKTILWEHEPLFAHTGFQPQLPRPSQCDLVVSILWSRLGTRLPADFAPEPGQPPLTGTEFEVKDALAAYEKFGRPNLLIYRKRAPPHVDMASADAEERFRQYRQLTEFCRTAFYDAQGAAIVAHHGFADGADFERQLTEHARKWITRELEKAGEHELRPRWTGGSPFRGLQPFDAEHQDVFFGRSQAVGELIRRLHASELEERSGEARAHLLLIIGMSGNGKTSLVRAGLLPFLADRPIEGVAVWYTACVRPSDVDNSAPHAGVLGTLAARISAALPGSARIGLTVPQLAEALRAEPVAAAARIETYLAAEAADRKIPAEQARLLIYIDQLEEIFTLPSLAAHATALLDAAAALSALATVWTVATLRSDFVHRLESYPAIMQMLGRSPPYTLLAPRGDELSDMIREPAAAAGLDFEERDGVSLEREILREATANPESLPLLQYALQQLYGRREGRTLLWEVYKPFGREGGLRGSLVEVAEGLISAIAADADAVFWRVMRELTSVGEDGSATRRYALLDAFPAGSEERALVDRLVDARLAVTDRHGIQPVVCLAHEALLQSWPRVVAWLQQESMLLRLRDELQRDAHVWETHGRSDGWLGTAPDKLATLGQLEREGMVPAGVAAEYAERSRRRAQRNRLIKNSAVASICVLGVISIIAGALAVHQRDRALAEAMTADRTSRFMVSLFKLADPGENRGNSVTVREVLDRGARDITHGLESEPRVRADLLTAMGEAYTGLGLYDPAKQLLAQARADQDAVRVPPESRVRTLIALGLVLDDSDELEDAKTQLQRALDLARTQLPPDSLLISNARDGLADVLTQLKQYGDAERLCEAALIVDRKRGPGGAETLSQTLDTLAQALYSEGRLAEAEAPMREALALRKQYFGTHHALTAESINNLAAVLYQTGRYAEAASQWQEALPLYREVYGPEHPEVETLLNNLGRSSLMAGRVDEAIPLLEQALQMAEKLKGPTHDDLVLPLNSLGMAYLYDGDTARARSDIDRALQIARRRNPPILDQVILNAADLELSTHQIDRALPLLSEARKLLEAQYPLTTDPSVQWRYAAWDAVNAEFLALENYPDDARAIFARAREVLVKRFGPQGFYVLRLDQRAATLTAAAASKHE